MEEYNARVEELRKHTRELIQKLDEEKKVKQIEEQNSQQILEKHSKLVLTLPTVFPLDQLYKLLCHRKVIELKHIQDFVTPNSELSQDWVTIAVLVYKSETKQSSNGSNYIIFTLGDLEGVEVTFFVFGEAYSDLCKEVRGSVLAILNASPLPVKDGKQNYKIEKASKVLKIGNSAHYARCGGIDGIERCDGYVNVKKTKICAKHSRPKIVTMRPELGNIYVKKRETALKEAPAVKKLPRHVYEPKPNEFSTLDRYLANRNKLSKEFGKFVEIEVNVDADKSDKDQTN